MKNQLKARAGSGEDEDKGPIGVFVGTESTPKGRVGCRRGPSQGRTATVLQNAGATGSGLAPKIGSRRAGSLQRG